MMNQFLDGKRYISGLWRILDTWGNLHSILSGKGSFGWFYGYAALLPSATDVSFTLNYLEGCQTEEEADAAINRIIDSLFVNQTPLYKTDLNIDSPPELKKLHFFEVRSADPKRVREVVDLAKSIAM